ncbi:MAG: hypothetical protein ABR499_01700 [Gemmatimonadaceae bacterium]
MNAPVRIRITLRLAVACAWSVTPCAARAQESAEAGSWSASDTSVAKFVSLARAGTARYRDQRAAVDDGYRRVGMDFPSMGEHWVSHEYVIGGVLDPARPAILSYTEVAGAPELVGVVYAIPLGAGEALPMFPPSARRAWHIHAGSVDEESLLLDHDLLQPAHDGAHGVGETTGASLRLAVLHVWLWAENPAGVFVTDNWALPFRRLGLTSPAELTASVRDAGRTLSLAVGDGEEYYRRLFTAVVRPEGEREVTSLANALVAARRSAERWVSARRQSGWRPMLTPDEIDALAAVWSSAWEQARSGLGATAQRRLAELAGAWR